MARIFGSIPKNRKKNYTDDTDRSDHSKSSQYSLNHQILLAFGKQTAIIA